MYDAFMSYSSKDKTVAKQIATTLMERGIDIWFDDWEMKPGESLIEKISDAITGSSYLFVLLSKNSVTSNWVRQELRQAMTEEIYADKVKVVPIIIEKCEVPGFLKDKLYVDFTDEQPRDYNLQKLIDLVFENPRAADRPQFGKDLFEEYYELLSDPDCGHAKIETLGKQVARAIESHMIPSNEIGYPEGSYPKAKIKLAEVYLVLNQLKKSADAYGCCFNYAKEKKNLDILFPTGLAYFCVLCFQNEKAVAEAFLEEFYSTASTLIPDDSSLSLEAILNTVVYVCFFESLGVENALEAVYNGDHHLLNLRIDRVLEILLKGFDKQKVDGDNVRFILASMLEDLGLFRPAISLYKKAIAEGKTEAEKRLQQADNNLSAALEMAPYFRHGVSNINPGEHQLTINLEDPKSLTRTLMCAGVYADVSGMVNGLKEHIVENGKPRRKIGNKTNGISPVKIIVYEDIDGSAEQIVNSLGSYNVGVVTVGSNDQAEASLAKYNNIRLYVCDHHDSPGGLIQISGVLFERDELKKNTKGYDQHC